MNTYRNFEHRTAYSAVLRNRVFLWIGVLLIFCAFGLPPLFDIGVAGFIFSLVTFLAGLVVLAFVLIDACARTVVHYTGSRHKFSK
jgi:hypothetical protein